MNLKKLNVKEIVIGILVCIGSGYGMYEVTPFLISLAGSNDIHCDTITEEDWQKSPIHDQAKSLDDFKQLCMNTQHQLDEQTNNIPILMAILPTFFVITAFRILRLGIKDDEQPFRHGVEQN